MKRRGACRAIAALALGIALPAQAQTGFRVAWVSLDQANANSPVFAAFRAGMADLGYVEGRNLHIDAWWGEGSVARLEQMAERILAAQPDVIVTHGGGALGPIRRSGTKRPIVFGMSADPVDAKVAESYARPGGNATGITLFDSNLIGKRMELLREILPGAARLAIIANPQHPGEHRELGMARAAAGRLGLALGYFPVRSVAELDAALTEVASSRMDAALVFSDGLAVGHAGRIAAFSLQSRIPVIAGWATFAERGVLVAYGPVFTDVYRRVAVYVDKIRKGAKPSELPVEQPTRIELVINLTTAKAIGLTVPQSVLLRADRVIE